MTKIDEKALEIARNTDNLKPVKGDNGLFVATDADLNADETLYVDLRNGSFSVYAWNNVSQVNIDDWQTPDSVKELRTRLQARGSARLDQFAGGGHGD
jgi:hypothetical protein